MPDRANRFIAELLSFASLSPSQQAAALQRTEEWSEAAGEELEALCTALASENALPLFDGAAPPAWAPLLQSALSKAARRRYGKRPAALAPMTPQARDAFTSLYRKLGQGSGSRPYLLMHLATARTRDRLTLLAELFSADPPETAEEVALALGSLFDRADYDPRALFPKLFDALADRTAAPVVLDLANYLCRRGVAAPHPAVDRVRPLTSLLGELIHRLDAIAEQPENWGRSPAEVAGVIGESTALAVSLCDALALCEAFEAVPKLRQALDLPHRRIRAEAAAALVRLGDPAGVDALVSLASEPSARLRVLAYAEELQVIDRIAPEYQTPEARAEAELASWLGEPTQFGLPPLDLTLIDARTLSWPGYDDPQECFLFRYRYVVADQPLENIGIAGPLTHAVAANLTHLAPSDLYAYFAGSEAEHPDIRYVPAAAFDESQRQAAQRRLTAIRQHGIQVQSIALLGQFFGETVAVGEGDVDGEAVLAVAEGDEVHLLAAGPGPLKIGPEDAWRWYVGRSLLRSFNPNEADFD